MTKTVGHKQRDIKNANHRLILAQLRRYGKMSRIDLARRLSLSAPSISKNVDELIGYHILQEVGTVVTNVGRRPCLVEINRDYGCVAVIDFSSSDTRVALSNMRAELIDYVAVPGGSVLDDSHLDKVTSQLRDMLGKQTVDRPLLAIGIGTPGDIDRKTGDFLYAPRFRNCGVRNLKKYFEEAFSADVLVKNDVNLATMGENLFGAGAVSENMLYVSVDYGVGSGMILNGRLLEGARGFAGEIGLWDLNAEKALEAYEMDEEPAHHVLDTCVSCFAIEKNVCRLLEQGRESILLNWVSKADEVTIDIIIKAYRLRDALCVEVVRKAALYLACALKNVIDLLDVEKVVIGGLSRKFGDEYLDVVKGYLEKIQPTSPPQLMWARLGHESTLYGAIGDALEYTFDQVIFRRMDGEAAKRC